MKEETFKLFCVIIFAYLGVFIRVGLASLSKIPHDSLLPRLGASFFLANIVGTFLLGFLTPMAEIFKPHYTAIHVGIISGFCGSCTTFATWQLIAAAQFLTGKWLDSVLQSLITFATSYLAMMAGFHSGDHVRNIIVSKTSETGNPSELEELGNGTKRSPVKNLSRNTLHQIEFSERTKSPKPNGVHSKTLERVLLLLLIAVTAGIWTGVFRDPSLVRSHWWVAVAFGPIGALIRYRLSLHNSLFPNFPLFTFIVNIAGTVINMGILMVDNHMEGYPMTPGFEDTGLSTSVARSTARYWVRFGVSTGLMGSLSTVSTWISQIFELSKKNRWLSYRYALASLVTAQFSCCVLGGLWILGGKSLKL